MREHTRTLAAAIALASLAACGGSDTVESRVVPMARVNAFWANTELRQDYTIRTDVQWRAAWQAHEPPTLPATARPTIDFSRHMVLGLTHGSGPNGCHGLSIRRVVEEKNQLRVEYLVSLPPPGVLCTQAIVPLTDFVVVELSDKPVSFVQAGA